MEWMDEWGEVSEWKKGFATLCHKCGLVRGSGFHVGSGGVNCGGCSKSPSASSEEIHKLCQCGGVSIYNGINRQQKFPPSHNIEMNSKEMEIDSSGSVEREHTWLSTFHQPSRENRSPKSVHTSLVSTELRISLSPSPNADAEERQLAATSSFELGWMPCQLLPRLPNPVLAAGLETNPSTIPQVRVARPPVEGRIRNQLLPRYWPRLTDQELQQISVDSNSSIVPLFEKVLSASDAGRIGRLVLPKACAEAYFPPISQPEGLPLRIKDVKGKEWLFQFRFWPNNNSRMYVLEGVTPCIQSMQLQAGDTVTFSRMNPCGELLMGFRKASGTTSHKYPAHNGLSQGEALLGNSESQPIKSGYSRRNSYLGSASNSVVENTADQLMLVPERKRRNIGPKSKRLLIDGHDSLELTLSWEEMQDMLYPPPSVEPTIFSVEDHEFEEYEEPPVFGKRSIFIARLSGEQEQWAQCDSCFKWRKVPIGVLLPPKWTCHENVYDRTRCSCSAPDELSAKELENLLKMNNDFMKTKVAVNLKTALKHETVYPENPTNRSERATSSAAATTKHPRHRPGCSCIVCIQPPSGKGKHLPTCECNVCSTVKRRFKTLMMRKKKRQSEHEAEIAHADGRNSESEKTVSRCPSEPRWAPCRVSMVSLVEEASLPLESYLREKGLKSLVAIESVAMADDHGASTAPAGVVEHKEEGTNNISRKVSKGE